MSAKKALQPQAACSVKITFRTHTEKRAFTSTCEENEQSQGGFARLAILEKIERDRKMRNPA